MRSPTPPASTPTTWLRWGWFTSSDVTVSCMATPGVAFFMGAYL
jgi:hypothetical protein